jgi:prepilin-type N-terminal cleavage/methylation domain-containing protein
VNQKLNISNCHCPGSAPRAFTLIEIMVVMALLSLIVIALMGVFNATQTAFRASVTQTDVLEGGRAAMDLIADDLRGMSPSLGYSNFTTGAVNFYANTNSNVAPLIQQLVASSQQRTNVLENFFILSRDNQTWTGTGYVVDTASTNYLNPLYRFSWSTNVAAANPLVLYYIFASEVSDSAFTNMSHLMDGVVGLRVRAYDPNGLWLTNGYSFPMIPTVKNTYFLPSTSGEVGFYMFSNTLPASVEIEMATLEDRTLQTAGTWPNGSAAQNNYLAQQAGKVHVFRQRVTIPNVDPTAYQ